MRTLILSLFFMTTTAVLAQQNNTPYVSVTGKGKVTVVPDEVTINLGVNTVAKDAKTAKAENDKAIGAVLKFTKKMGISENNVKTQYVSLNQGPKSQGKVDYYAAQQSISIKIDDLDKYEKLMAGLMDQGANTINGVNFSSSKMEEYKKKARAAAVNDAKEKAGQYAQVLGQSIGSAIAITETGSPSYNPRPMMMKMSSSGDVAAQSETLAPGEMEITEEISISFELTY